MNVIVMLGVVALIGNARASDQYSEWYPEEAYAGDYGMKKVVSYEYEVNDYYGNEQSKRETIDGQSAKGEYRTRMPDGKLQVVTYDSGPHGHLANVKYEDQPASYSVSTPPPAQPYHVPSTPGRPQHDDRDVRKVLSYEYEINDYAGNEQSKKETIDGGTALGEYKTRMPDGQLQVVTYESGPNGHLASVKYESGAAAPPLYGTGAEKPLYGAVRPYVRTSSDVKYIKMARPSYPSHPFYAMSRPAYAKPGHQATYATAYEPSRRSYRGPRPTYTSPTVPPYAPAVYHRSYGTKYPAADSMY